MPFFIQSYNTIYNRQEKEVLCNSLRTKLTISEPSTDQEVAQRFSVTPQWVYRRKVILGGIKPRETSDSHGRD